MIEIKVTKGEGGNSTLVIEQFDSEGAKRARVELWISENGSTVPMAIDVVQRDGAVLTVEREH